MQPHEDDTKKMRNAAFVILAVLMVLAFTSSKLGISLTGAIAFWSIVLALASVVALLSVIFFHQ